MSNEAFDAGVVAAMEKVAFSMTPEGHKFDTEMAKAREKAMAEEVGIAQKYKGMRGGKKGFSVGRALRGFQSRDFPFDLRHQAYVAKRHAKGKNAWNPWGGLNTPSKYERGGTKEQLGSIKVKD